MRIDAYDTWEQFLFKRYLPFACLTQYQKNKTGRKNRKQNRIDRKEEAERKKIGKTQ